MGLLSFFKSTSDLETANRFFDKQCFAQAVPHFARAIELNQEPALSAMKLGLCYQTTGDYGNAEKSFSLASKLNPANTQAWIMLSIAQTMLKRFADAKSTAARGLSYSPNSQQAGECRLAFLQAATCEIEAIGDHRATKFNVNEILKRTALINEAIPMFEQCITEGTKVDEAWKFYGLIGIYAFQPKMWSRAMKSLRNIRSPYYESMKLEFRRCYGYEIVEEG